MAKKRKKGPPPKEESTSTAASSKRGTQVLQREKRCGGRDLAKALVGVHLDENEAKAWRRDVYKARRMLKPPAVK
jgi:hypothetical protein